VYLTITESFEVAFMQTIKDISSPGFPQKTETHAAMQVCNKVSIR